MAKVISGKDLAKKRKDNMALELVKLENKYGRRPNLAVILVGDDAGSISYVAGKEKACNEIGIGNLTIRKPSTITQDELLAIINDLNNLGRHMLQASNAFSALSNYGRESEQSPLLVTLSTLSVLSPFKALSTVNLLPDNIEIGTDKLMFCLAFKAFCKSV